MATTPIQVPRPKPARQAEATGNTSPANAKPATPTSMPKRQGPNSTHPGAGARPGARWPGKDTTAASRMAERLQSRLADPLGSTASSPEQDAAAELQARHLAPLVAAGDLTAMPPTTTATGPPIDPGPARSGAGALSGLGSGTPLPEDLRAEFESVLGVDLDGVRLHTGPAAAAAAARHGAKALTLGRHLVFGRGQYRPETADGRRRLGHELINSLQQRSGRPRVQADPVFFVDNRLGRVSYRIWPNLGLIGVTLDGEPWVTVRWDAKPGRIPPKFVLQEDNEGEGYGIGAEAPYGLRVTVNRNAEANYASTRPFKTAFAHRYLARGAQVQITASNGACSRHPA